MHGWYQTSTEFLHYFDENLPAGGAYGLKITENYKTENQHYSSCKPKTAEYIPPPLKKLSYGSISTMMTNARPVYCEITLIILGDG